MARSSSDRVSFKKVSVSFYLEPQNRIRLALLTRPRPIFSWIVREGNQFSKKLNHHNHLSVYYAQHAIDA